MKKNTYLLLILILFSLILCCACAEKHNPADALIGEDGTSSYIIVRPDTTDNATDAAVALNKEIAARTGTELGLTTDFVAKAGSAAADLFKENDAEILVGVTNREATASIAAELPRSLDWGIARTGTKITIYGTECIDEAIQYFLDNYVVDGNIYIADGEKYLHLGEYTIDSFTLGGTNIADCLIRYDTKNPTYETLASNLAAEIESLTGLDMETKRYLNSDTSPQIAFLTDDSLETTQTVCRMNGSVLEVAYGILADPSVGYDMLLDYIKTNVQNKALEIDSALSLSQEGDSTHMKVADEAYLKELDAKADAMKEAILNTESEYTVGAATKIYYFSEEGDDSNDGLSEETPVKTLARLKTLPLKRGDVVLFRRGDMFRGNITTVAGVTYSAYGEGAKPIINSSKMNYADPALWQETEYENVWLCTKPLNNAGIVALDHSGELGKYDELTGICMVAGQGTFTGAKDLYDDLQFYSDLNTQKFYFYSTEGNPGERFESIEIGERLNTISPAADTTIDNLHITLTGAHGVGAGTTKNLTVRNCIFNWLGGSILAGFGGGNTTRYGNAVEVYGGVDGYNVYNNWIYQIYDTGITHQFNVSADTKTNNMKNVEYYDNLIEYCFWSIEYYNNRPEGTTRETINVSVHDNFCRYGGYGWGCAGRETSAPMCSFWISTETIENNTIENNIFDRCLGVLVFMSAESPITFSNNTYVQAYNTKFLNLWTGTKMFDATAADSLTALGETNPTLVYVMEETGK
ncbi:MAG: hypothetical protein IJ493_03335 [Clostridia bacterium]|nr:hypothetical protein [Clostridia bacterium]